MPDVTTYTEARKNLSSTMDKVCDTHEPVIITRQKASPVVIMSLDDYNSIMETDYLLRSPANAKRLRQSLDELDSGGGQAHDLVDPERG